MQMTKVINPRFDPDREYPASYLGDGVYAIYDGFGIWLHTSDHNNPTDKVYMEPTVITALNQFVEDIKKL